MTKAIIFDCFGVVVSDALNLMCGQLLADRPDDVRTIWGLIERTNKGLMNSDESSTQIGELFGMNLADYRQQLLGAEIKNQQLLNYIKDLQPAYQIAMLSNVGVGSLARRFAPGELEQYFGLVVASADIGYAKPEPEAYQITADRLGVQPDECLFVDDRKEYCAGARAIGMQTVLYANFPQFKTDLTLLLANS